jgi:hypothetical protein
MSIEALTRVMPPPEVPVDAFLGRWGPIEVAIGSVLPPDYKDFARRYGFGRVMDFVVVDLPNNADGGARFAREMGQVCWDCANRGEDGQNTYWPTPGGLMPFGWTANGDQLFWLTRGEPVDWRVAVWDRGGAFDEPVEVFDCDLTDFVAGLTTGAIRPKAFPDDFFPFQPLFQPLEG